MNIVRNIIIVIPHVVMVFLVAVSIATQPFNGLMVWFPHSIGARHSYRLVGRKRGMSRACMATGPHRLVWNSCIEILAFLKVATSWVTMVASWKVSAVFCPLGLGRDHPPPQLGGALPEGLANLFVGPLLSDLQPYEGLTIANGVALSLDEPNALGPKGFQEFRSDLGFFAACRAQIGHLVCLDGFFERQISRMGAGRSSPTAHHVHWFQRPIGKRGRRPRLRICQREGIIVVRAGIVAITLLESLFGLTRTWLGKRRLRRNKVQRQGGSFGVLDDWSRTGQTVLLLRWIGVVESENSNGRSDCLGR